MSTFGHAAESADLVSRFRRVLSTVQLECRCRSLLDGTLDRFSAFESQRQLRQGLRDARDRRDRIAARLSFLTELDEFSEREADRSVFEEMALLFQEISAEAANAAQALRELKSATAR